MGKIYHVQKKNHYRSQRSWEMENSEEVKGKKNHQSKVKEVVSQHLTMVKEVVSRRLTMVKGHKVRSWVHVIDVEANTMFVSVQPQNGNVLHVR